MVGIFNDIKSNYQNYIKIWFNYNKDVEKKKLSVPAIFLCVIQKLGFENMWFCAFS